ncbi:MAG: SirA family protein [Methylotenera sp.]|jgi:TusA-related sulfurtransferase|uniref:sulfurtransferase TusA family protein n=1 Tax=Methylotenera sp. TaxID=2051956 RepID=UPI000D437263|nr:sulfurtransferase TusA family protein [Methylotenera sp.]MDP3211965.1 sulfurtransferase TusA family protein [Methylotenera sp.]MDP3777221.1 sulfurtransferase TusA family protein [Methylotenera sp.]PPC98005.1 MAG: SirA family protein [Methylotenera sp.]
MTINFNSVLDVRHEDSPIPTIRTKEALDALPSGEILKVITSKESTINNIRTLVANNQFTLLQELKNEEGFVFLIQK